MPLVEKATDIQLAWKSEAYVEDTYTGGYSSPVVADGKVYVYFYQGDGKNLEEGYFPEQGWMKSNYKAIPKEEYAKRPSPAADEVVLCLDARTGKTLWKFVSPSTGLNHQRENTAGHYTPCVGEGKVVVQGCTGIIFCLDAQTGKLLWQYEHENYTLKRRHRDETVAKREVTRDGGPDPFPWSAPVITGGNMIIGTRGAKVDGKNLGGKWEAYDLATGQRLWQTPGGGGGASPILWRHTGKEYVIGLDVCLDPATGKVLWTMPKGEWGHSSGTPALDGNILVYSGGNGRGANAWRLTLEGTTKLWERDPKETVNSCGSSLGAHRGVAYIHCSRAKGAVNDGYVLAIELATGKELARHDGNISVKTTPSVVAIADRVIFPHLSNAIQLFGIGADFHDRGVLEHKTGFAKAATPAVVDGFLYSRGKDALYCFDLRREK